MSVAESSAPDSLWVEKVREQERRLLGAGSPFRLEFEPRVGPRRFASGPYTLTEVLLRATRGDLNRPLLISAADRWSVSALAQLGQQVAETLTTNYGLISGERVGLLLQRPEHWIAALLGLVQAGAVAVLLPSTASDAELTEMLELAPCRLVLVDAVRSGLPHELLDWDIAVGRSNRAATVRPASPSPASEAIVAFTSGSMGRPKAVSMSHEAVVSGLRSMQLAAALATIRRVSRNASASAGRTCTLVLSPLTHVSGYSQVLLALMGGGSIAYSPQDEAVEAVLALIARERVTGLVGVSADLLWAMLRRSCDFDLSSLRSIGLFGAAVDPIIIEKIAAHLPDAKVGGGYGMTETCGAIATATDEDIRARPGTVGRVVPSARIKIESIGDRNFDRSSGEVWIGGPMLAAGYYAEGGKLASASLDGWFPTGDRGYLDRDGFLYILDRQRKPLSQGTGLFTTDLENAVRRHPSIAETAVVEVGADAAALIQIAYTCLTPVSVVELKAHLNEQIPSVKGPMEWKLLDRLPRRPSGKVDYDKLAGEAPAWR